MSRRARSYQDAYDAKHYPERWDFQPDWRDDRDDADKPPPEPDDEPPPSNTFT